MAGEEVPERVLSFLDTCIDSVEQLSVLLLLHSEPKRIWTTTEITSELRSSDTSIAKRLDDLYSRKVLVRIPALKDRHQFNLSTPGLQTVIDELAYQYQIRPYRIIEAIYSRPNKAILAFAQAFKFGGDKS